MLSNQDEQEYNEGLFQHRHEVQKIYDEPTVSGRGFIFILVVIVLLFWMTSCNEPPKTAKGERQICTIWQKDQTWTITDGSTTIGNGSIQFRDPQTGNGIYLTGEFKVSCTQ